MNVRKHAFALVFGSILVIVAGGIGFLLFRSRADYQDVKEKLAAAESRYNTLTNEKPYPSPENVELVKENAEAGKEFYADLLSTLCENQPPREDVNTAQFAVRLQDTFADLRLAATNQAVDLRSSADEFYFGFEQYTGVLPDRGDIPRLLGQLRTVESICRLLFENRITSLQGVRRDVFERPQSNTSGAMRMGRGRMGGGGMPEPGMMPGGEDMLADDGGDLYTIEHLDMTFLARDSQVWSVLDALGSSPQFTVVTSIELRNMASDQNRPTPMRAAAIRPKMMGGMNDFGDGFGEEAFFSSPTRRMSRPPTSGSSAREKEGGGLRLLSHDERVMAGKDELVEVILGLDIYRFCPEPAEEEMIDGTDLGFEG